MAAFCVLASSCAQLPFAKHQDKAPAFAEIYKNLSKGLPSRQREEEPQRLLTMSTREMPLLSWLRWLSDKEGISIVCDASLDDKPITIDVVNAPLADVLTSVARRLGVDLTQQGNLYYIGILKPEDRGVLVRKVRRLSAEDLQSAIEVLLSDIGRAKSYTDGLLIVGDRVRVLQRIHSMLDQIEGAESNTWIIQLYLLSRQNRFEKQTGFDSATSLDIAATFASKSVTETTAPAAFEYSLSGALKALLQASRSRNDNSLIAEPMFLLLDGSSANITDGETTPLPRKTVSDSGTVTTSGYDYVQSGINISASLREVSPKTAACKISISITAISGFVEDAPVTTGQKFETTVVLQSCGVYLLGELTRKDTSANSSGSLFTTLRKKNRNDGKIQVWLKCYRIGAPVTALPSPELE